MMNLIYLGIKEAHNPDSSMDEETRKTWFKLEKKMLALKKKLDVAVSHLTPEKVDPKELNKALAYFNTGSKYGWSDPTEDLDDKEIIDLYRRCLAREYVDEFNS